MSLERLEAALRGDSRHLSAFLMLGDPTPEISVALAVAAVDAGVTMLELGLPFSDPCADGPAIQQSCLRARAAGVSTVEALEVMRAIHAARPHVPLNLLVYGNLVHAPGVDAFCRAVADAGASSLLVPDFPLEESTELRAANRAHGLGHVSLVGPATPPERLKRIAAASSGFLYLAGYQGVTGKAAAEPAPGEPPASPADDGVEALVRRTVAAVDLPVCLGFGIQAGAQVRRAHDAGAQIVVVGSHLARAIDRALPDGAAPRLEPVRTAFLAALHPLFSGVPGASASPTPTNH